MGSINYSVPDDVKEAFNQTFKMRNKSAVISETTPNACLITADRRYYRKAHSLGAIKMLGP